MLVYYGSRAGVCATMALYMEVLPSFSFAITKHDVCGTHSGAVAGGFLQKRR